MKASSIAAAIALSLASLTGTAAHAANFENTYFLQPQYSSGLSQLFSYYSDFDTGVAGDTFTDTFIFGTPPGDPTTLQATVFSQLTFAGSPEVSFSSMVINDSLDPASATSLPLVVYGNSFGLSGHTTSSVDNGTYYLELTGSLLTSGAAYGGLLRDSTPGEASVQAVPEPSTTWLMALGLGGLGLVTARKKRKV